MLSLSLPSGFPFWVRLCKLELQNRPSWPEGSDSSSAHLVNCHLNLNKQQTLVLEDPVLPLGFSCSPGDQGSWLLWLCPVSLACLPSSSSAGQHRERSLKVLSHTFPAGMFQLVGKPKNSQRRGLGVRRAREGSTETVTGSLVVWKGWPRPWGEAAEAGFLKPGCGTPSQRCLAPAEAWLGSACYWMLWWSHVGWWWIHQCWAGRTWQGSSQPGWRSCSHHLHRTVTGTQSWRKRGSMLRDQEPQVGT